MNSVTPMAVSESDHDLMKRFRESRDREAFGLIVRRYGPVVFGVCRRMLGDFQRAEDAFQQTFLSLARQADLIRKPEALPGWLYTTARRSALAAVAPKDQRSALPEQLASPDRDPLAEISGRDMLRAIEEELAELPEEYRTAILLCGIEGLSVDEAADRVGSTNGSIRGCLQRGRALLKTRLIRRGIELPAALAVVFGTPSLVPAATTQATIEASLAVAALNPGIGLRLVSLATSPGTWAFLILIVSGLLGWKLFHAIPKPELPPLDVAKWELSTDTPLPKGAIARIGDGRHTLDLGKRLIRFADEDKVLVAVGTNEFLAWDVTKGEQLHRTPLVEDLPCDVSSSGKWFIHGGSIYDSRTGKLYWQAFDDRTLTRVKFNGDDQAVAILHQPQKQEVTIRRLDVGAKTFKEAKFEGFKALPIPGGDQVAVWDRPADDYDAFLLDDENESTIRIHSIADPKAKPVVISGFKGEPLEVACNAEGTRLFAASVDRQLSCWNTQTGERIYQATIPIPPTNHRRGMGNGLVLDYFSRKELTLMYVSPRGDKVLWCGWSKSEPIKTICHSVEKKKILWTQDSALRTAYATFLFDEPRGRLLVNDNRIEIHDADTGKRLSPEHSRYADRGPVSVSHQMDVSKNGRLLAFCNRTIGLYDVEKILDENSKPTMTPELKRMPEGAIQCGFVPGSESLVWGTQSNLAIIDHQKQKTVAITEFFLSNAIVQEDFSKAEWSYLDLWNSKRGKLIWDGSNLQKSKEAIPKEIKSIAEVDRQLGVGKSFGDQYYTAIRMEGDQREVRVASWSLVTGAKDWEQTFEDSSEFEVTSTSTRDGKMYYPELAPKKICVSPNGKQLLVLTNTQIEVLDSGTGAKLHRWKSEWKPTNRVEFENVEFSRDGTQLIIGVSKNRNDRHEIQIRDVKELNKLVRTIDLGHPRSYSIPGSNIPIAQSPDGKLLATSVGGAGLKVFELVTGKVLYHLPQVTNSHGVSISQDNRRLLANEGDQINTALVWDLNAFAVKKGE